MKKVARVKIQETPWTSLRRGRPKYTEKVILLKEGDLLTLSGLAEHYQLKVVKLDGHAIEIEPIGRSPAPVRQGGGVAFKDSIGRTQLTIGQSIEVSTLTMDVGVKWRISLQGVESQHTSSQQKTVINPQL